MEKFRKHPAVTDEKLRWKIAEGISTSALHYQADEKGPEKSLSFGEAVNEWKFLFPFELSENRELLFGLQNGLEAIEIPWPVNTQKQIFDLLKGVHPEMVEMHLHNTTDGDPKPMLDFFTKICAKTKTDTLKLRGSIRNCNPELLQNFESDHLKELPGIKVFYFASIPQNEGGDRITELGSIFGDLLREMEKSVLSPTEYLKRCVCRMYVGSDIMADMVKIRAFHLLWSLVTDELKCGIITPDLEVSVSPSSYTGDPFKNLIISSAVALSSAVSGVQRIHFPLLTVDDTGKLSDPKAFNLRMTLNISHILKYESHFDKITDPLAGSHTFETLAEEMAKKAWNNAIG